MEKSCSEGRRKMYLLRGKKSKSTKGEEEKLEL